MEGKGREEEERRGNGTQMKGRIEWGGGRDPFDVERSEDVVRSWSGGKVMRV